MRFFDWRPLDAARVVLEENGGKMKREELVDSIVAGGITHGKKRGLHNIRTSLELNIQTGNLIERVGIIILPKTKP